MNAPLPPMLADNPVLARWIAFPSAGRVTVFTGRVEFGQGVLTVMTQIAADELDVAIARIDVVSGDTALTPNEGYTAGSMPGSLMSWMKAGAPNILSGRSTRGVEAPACLRSAAALRPPAPVAFADRSTAAASVQ